MPTNLTNKVYALTGAASGIGLATARLLLTSGASVALSDINSTTLTHALSSLPLDQQHRTFTQVTDVTSRASVHSFLAAAKTHFGHVDGIASVAGTGGHKLGLQSISETSDDEYDFIVDLNLRGTYHVLSESLVAGYFADGQPASIVSVGSMFSARGFRKGAVFAASKHAALGLVKSVAMEVAERGVRVNAVLPGAVDTPMHQANLVSGADHPVPNAPIARAGEPEEIAAVIQFLLSDESKFVTGAAWTIDGGANA